MLLTELIGIIHLLHLEVLYLVNHLPQAFYKLQVVVVATAVVAVVAVVQVVI